MHLKTTFTLLLAVLGGCGLVFAQRADSLSCSFDHSFSLRQAIAPAALLTAGASISFTSLHERWDIPLHDWSQQDGHARAELENMVQYLPGASVLIFKACGMESRHGWRDLVSIGAGASLTAFALNTGMKYSLGVERPYPGVYNSFPSGHTVTAFVGAEILRREYGDDYPAVAVAGYAVAAGVGAMRICNNRHWASDVLAGAGVGILSASIMYWLAPYLRF